MSLYYAWGWDFAGLPDGASMSVTDDGGSFTVTYTTGTYCHTDLSDVTGTGNFVDLASKLQTDLNTGSSGAGTYVVAWRFSTNTDYSIVYSAGNFSIDFTGTDAQVNMRRILGFTGDVSGADNYSSVARSYYHMIPSIQGRSFYSDELEPEGISDEAAADDGTCYQISKSTVETEVEWQQVAEPATLSGATLSSEWTPPFERQGVTAVPWSYQHAFRHARTEQLPFAVVEGSDASVYELRASGTSFRPLRFASPDFPLWSVPFKTRLLGNL